MNDKPAMANTQAFAVITQDELSSLRAELAELRARVPAICFPRQPNGEGGWVIDANYVAAIHKDCFPIEWQVWEEEVEAVLLAVERAAPVTPAAVPEDVAKDAERLDWLVSEVALVQSLAISPPHGDGTTRYHIVWPEYGEDQRDTYATPREAIDAAILAAKENKP